MMPPSSPTTNMAWHACVSCKSRKRKCDKALPACALCQSKDWKCDYANSSVSSPGSQEPIESRLLFPDSQRPFASQPLERSGFPAVFFLDANTFQQAGLEIPRPEIAIPLYVQHLNGGEANIRPMATEYFETIHPYMPIVSKLRFYRQLINPLSRRRADVALLLLCMRLVSMLVPDEMVPSRAPIYLAATQFYSELETMGDLSLQILQARVLISLYELGHAIYPAAYMTVGACARCGISLGLNRRGIYQVSSSHDWIEIEERKRVWWAVLILDRFVNLGNPSRALATEEPDGSSILPIDDEAWDKGVQPSGNSYTLSSPSSLNMGRFARFAQATYLLGQVLRHISDDNTASKSFRNEEAAQLRRTIYALVNLSEVEGDIRNLDFCTQTAICYSALLILENFYTFTAGKVSSCVERCAPKITIAERAASISRAFLQLHHPHVKKVSPVILPLLYHTSAIYAEIYSETRSKESAEALQIVKQAMRVLGEKWKSAGAYLEILNAREVISSW